MPDSAVSYGFLLPTRELVMSQTTPDVGRIIDLAERAEALDFDSVWAGDSILARPRLEAFTTLAAVAARARRFKVGTAVLLPALRHPVVMANEAATSTCSAKAASSSASASLPRCRRCAPSSRRAASPSTTGWAFSRKP